MEMCGVYQELALGFFYESGACGMLFPSTKCIFCFLCEVGVHTSKHSIFPY